MKSSKLFLRTVIISIAVLFISLTLNQEIDANGGREYLVNWGAGRHYRLFVPADYTPGEELPLVVMLHGCAQTSAQFRDGTQMNAVAATERFIVMYPEQSTAANSSRCWNWFETAHQRRGSGEPQIIVDMVRHVQSTFSINSDAVFVSGLSAGGAMSVTLGLLYPDYFTAIAPFAGLALQSGTSMLNAFSAMSPGNTAVPPATAAQNAFNQVPVAQRRVVPAIIFHGTSDFTVVPRASEHIVTQLLAYNLLVDPTLNTQLSTTHGQAGNLAYTVETHRHDNAPLIQFYRITGLGHSWSGGNGAIAHTDARGPQASQLAWEFFQSVAGLEYLEIGNDNDNDNDYTEIGNDNDDYIEIGNDNDNDYTEVGNDSDYTDNDGDELPPIMTYTVVSANVNIHNLQGRIPAHLFLHYFMLHGPMTPFNMYQIDGTQTWTSTRPTQ